MGRALPDRTKPPSSAGPGRPRSHMQGAGLAWPHCGHPGFWAGLARVTLTLHPPHRWEPGHPAARRSGPAATPAEVHGPGARKGPAAAPCCPGSRPPGVAPVLASDSPGSAARPSPSGLGPLEEKTICLGGPPHLIPLRTPQTPKQQPSSEGTIGRWSETPTRMRRGRGQCHPGEQGQCPLSVVFPGA